VHGEYKSPPRLDFARLKRIRHLLQIPLVLHGASGLQESMISESIRLGVCKFNVNTEVRQAYMLSLQDGVCAGGDRDLLEIAEEAIAAMQVIITEKFQLFGSVNMAHLHETPLSAVLAAYEQRPIR